MRAISLFSGSRTAWTQWVSSSTKLVGGYPDPIQHLRPLLSEEWCVRLLGELRRKFDGAQRYHPLWWAAKSLLKGDKRYAYNRGLVVLLTSHSFGATRLAAAKASTQSNSASGSFRKRISSKDQVLLPQHYRLADICETVYMAMTLHRTVVNTAQLIKCVNDFDDNNDRGRIRLSATGSLAATEVDSLQTDSSFDENKNNSTVEGNRQNISQLLEELELGNKLATLCGGMLFSTISTGLGELENPSVVENVSRSMSASIESQFTRYATLCEPSLDHSMNLLTHLIETPTSLPWPPLAALHHSAQLLSPEDWENYVSLHWTSPLMACAHAASLMTASFTETSPQTQVEEETLLKEFLEPWSYLYRLCEELHSLSFTLRAEEVLGNASNSSLFSRRSSDKQRVSTRESANKNDSLTYAGPRALVEDLWISQPPRGPSLAHILFCRGGDANEKAVPSTALLSDFTSELLSPSSSDTFQMCLHSLSRYADKSRLALSKFPSGESTALLHKMVDLLEKNCHVQSS